MKLIDADKLFAAFEDTDWFDNADRDIAENMLLDAPVVNQTEQPGTGLEGCWHCRNIEAHRIEYVIAVRTKGGRPMNMPVDCPYHYCPACGRKLEVE